MYAISIGFTLNTGSAKPVTMRTHDRLILQTSLLVQRVFTNVVKYQDVIEVHIFLSEHFWAAYVRFCVYSNDPEKWQRKSYVYFHVCIIERGLDIFFVCFFHNGIAVCAFYFWNIFYFCC